MGHDRRLLLVAAVLAVAVVALLVTTGDDPPASRDEAQADDRPSADLPDDVDSPGDLQWVATVDGADGRAPVVIGEVVVVATDDGGLAGIERDTGALLWRSRGVGGRPVEPVAVGPLAVTGAGTTLAAFRAVDGEPAWSLALPSALEVRPAVAGNRLVVGMSGGEIWGVDGHRGVRRWERSFGPVSVPPAADTRTVVVASGWKVQALDAASASVTWSDTADDEIAAVGVAHGVALAVTASGDVLSSGGWRFDVGGPVVAEPAAVGDVAVFATTEGDVRAVDVDTGLARWDRSSSVGVRSPLRARRDVVVVTTEVGMVHRLDPATGRLLGSARSGPGARVVPNPGPGPSLFSVADGDVVAGLR